MEWVTQNKQWIIKTQQDFDEAMKTLDENDFVAEMSDSYAMTCAEKREIRRQRADVIRQAKEIGLNVR